MRRFGLLAVLGIVVFAFAPASALARHHHTGHHRGHHGKKHHKHHARIRRFGSLSSSTSSGDTAGTVQSFNGGVLTIMLSDGSTVRGRVTRATEMECQAGDQNEGNEANEGNEPNEPNEASPSDGDRGGDNRGGDNRGEEQGEQENEQNCSTANLTPGAVVREAELRVSSSGSTWRKVELG